MKKNKKQKKQSDYFGYYPKYYDKIIITKTENEKTCMEIEQDKDLQISSVKFVPYDEYLRELLINFKHRNINR